MTQNLSLTFNSDGTVSGTSSGTGTTSTASLAVKPDGSVTGTWVEQGGVTISTTSLPSATVSKSYSASLSATSTTGGAVTWSLVSGTLPAGLGLLGSVISGTPTATGTSSLSFKVSDSLGDYALASFSLTVQQAVVAGGKNLVGSTVNLPAGTYGGCSGGQLDPCGGSKFDTFLSTGVSPEMKPAALLQKVYMNTGSLPATCPSIFTNFHKAGGKLLISIKPSTTFSASEDTAFKACLAGLVSALGVDGFKLILWQEPNTAKSPFATATAYHSYFDHYAPLVKAVNTAIVIVYDPALTPAGDQANMASCLAYYPGDKYVGEIECDYYGTAYNGGATLDQLAALADNHKDANGNAAPIPFGIGEWGVAAVGTYKFDLAKWTNYTNYLAAFFGNRAASGKKNGWLVYWASGPLNMLSSSTDPRIAGWQHVYKTLASTWPTE